MKAAADCAAPPLEGHPLQLADGLLMNAVFYIALVVQDFFIVLIHSQMPKLSAALSVRDSMLILELGART